MNTLNLRHKARECVSRSRKLLARGDEYSVRYACLELRFAIEYITYDQLTIYISEVSDETLKKWTPKQVISGMLEVDPRADQTKGIAVGQEHTPGVAPPPSEMQFLGNDRRFSIKWANKNHNALGNFLHAPTIYQIESGETPTLLAMTEKATEVANECDQILQSPIFHANFGRFVELDCQDCNTHIRRRVESITPELNVVCPKCQATYDIKSVEGEALQFILRAERYTCPYCNAESWIGDHHVTDGAIIKCSGCGKTALLEQRFFIIKKEDSTPAPEKNNPTGIH